MEKKFDGDYAFVDFSEWYFKNESDAFYVEIRNKYISERDGVIKFFPRYSVAINYARSLKIEIHDNISRPKIKECSI